MTRIYCGVDVFELKFADCFKHCGIKVDGLYFVRRDEGNKGGAVGNSKIKQWKLRPLIFGDETLVASNKSLAKGRKVEGKMQSLACDFRNETCWALSAAAWMISAIGTTAWIAHRFELNVSNGMMDVWIGIGLFVG